MKLHISESCIQYFAETYLHFDAEEAAQKLLKKIRYLTNKINIMEYLTDVLKCVFFCFGLSLRLLPNFISV